MNRLSGKNWQALNGCDQFHIHLASARHSCCFWIKIKLLGNQEKHNNMTLSCFWIVHTSAQFARLLSSKANKRTSAQFMLFAVWTQSKGLFHLYCWIACLVVCGQSSLSYSSTVTGEELRCKCRRQSGTWDNTEHTTLRLIRSWNLLSYLWMIKRLFILHQALYQLRPSAAWQGEGSASPGSSQTDGCGVNTRPIHGPKPARLEGCV